MVPEGSIHGQFQPFHNGHLDEVYAALERCVFLWIGLVGPDPSPHSRTPGPLLSSDTPLTYHECQFMITRTLVAEGIPPQRFGFHPFPIGTPDALPHFLDPRVTCFVNADRPGVVCPVEALSSAGFAVEPLEGIASPHSEAEVRAHLSGGDPAWRRMVPRSVAAYLEEIELGARLHDLKKGG